MEVGELAAQVRRNIARLRQELADEESFLARLEKHAATGPTAPQSGFPTPEPRPVETAATGVGATTSGRLAGRGEKKSLVRQIVSERPGRWSTRQIREELIELGIDPDAGTPVKNVLWQLAKEGLGSSLGSGEYEFPAPSADGNGDGPQEAST